MKIYYEAANDCSDNKKQKSINLEKQKLIFTKKQFHYFLATKMYEKY